MKTNRYLYLLLTACIIFSMRSFAQGICSSTALAPVFKQSFDSSKFSTSKSIVPTGFITNYAFQSSSALSDGEYIVTPLVQNSQKADWAVGGDHTGNTNGNMFLVNAGTGASLFFYQQVDNLCPGSVYSFSAWLVNVNTITKTKPICGSGYVYPKVTFNIKNTSGTVLQSYTTDTLPLTQSTTVSPNWQQYGFQFSLPAGTTSLILEMVDFYGGSPQCGNDLAIDDIVFSACTPTATVSFSTASTICSGAATNINSSLINSPYSSPAYQWQKSTDGGTTWFNIGIPGIGAASFPITNASAGDAGKYRVLVGSDVSSLTSSTCVTASNAVSLVVTSPVSVSVIDPGPICSGNTLSLLSNTSGGTAPYTFSWTGPNSFTSALANPSISSVGTVASGNYSVTVSDINACTASASKTVTVNNTPTVAAITGSSAGCSGSTLVLSNTTAGGIWSSDNTSVAIVGSGGLVTLVSGGTATISYTVTNGLCSAVATKLITVAGVSLHPDLIECVNGLTHFNATDTNYGVNYSNTNPGNSYLWSISGGAYSYMGSSTSTSQYPDVQFMSGAAYRVNIQFTTGAVTCSATQMIYTNTIPADTITGSHDTTICNNASSVSFSGKASAGMNVFNWTSSGSGTFSSPTALNTSYTPSTADKAAAIIKIYLTVSSSLNVNGGCNFNPGKDSMVLRISPDNTGTNSTQVICSNQRLNFTPISSIPGSNYSWTSVITGGSATGNTLSGTGNVMDSLINFSGTTTAVIKYTITPYVMISDNNRCTGTAFNFTAYIQPKPILTVTNHSVSICTGTAANISFNSSVAGSLYAWNSSVIAGSITGNSSNSILSATNIISDVLINHTNSNATVRYYLTVTSPSGCSNLDSTDVLVYGIPPNANAGPDQTLCNMNSALLAANNPITGTGKWTLLAGPSAATFSSVTSASSTVNGLVGGTYQLVWTVGNGPCIVSKDTVVIVNIPRTIAGSLLADNTVCAGTNDGTISLKGYTGNILRWESSTDNGKTWATILNDTGDTYRYVNIAATTLYKAVVQSGNCGSAYTDPVTITVNPKTVPGILSSAATVCAGFNNGKLSLAGYTGNIIRWESTIDNGNTWTNIYDTLNTLTYTDLTTTTQYRVLVQSGGCTSLYSNNIIIRVLLPITIADAGTDQVLCNTHIAVMHANTPSSGTGAWTNITGNPTIASFTNAGDPTATVTNLTSGTYRFAWTISNGICSPSSDTVLIKVDTVLSAFTLSSVNDCGKTTYRFSNTSQSAFGIKNYQWFNSKGDSMSSKDISQSYDSTGKGDMSLRAESNTGCSQTTQALFTIIIYQFPKANINAVADACRNQMLKVSSTVNSQDSIAYLLWNLGNSTKKNDSIVTVQYIQDGKYTIQLTVATINQCLDSTYKQILVHGQPVVSVNNNPMVCKGDSIELVASGAVNYIWTDSNDLIFCNGCRTTKVSPATNQQYHVIGYNEFGCSQSKTTQVRVVQPLKLQAIKGDTLCTGQSMQLFVSGASTYTWYPETGLSNKNTASPVARPASTITYQVIGKDDFNCFADTAQVQIVVGRSTPINIGKDTVLTAGSFYQLNTTTTSLTNEIRKWVWSSTAELSCKNCVSPTVKVINDAVISCLAINVYGCTSTDTIEIKTFCPATEIFIPNAFSPDGDGINDKLIVQGKGVKMIRYFRIFNRWGEVVFEKTNFLPGDAAYAWDGTVRGRPASPDVFVYVCEVICEKGLPTIFKGNVAILK